MPTDPIIIIFDFLFINAPAQHLAAYGFVAAACVAAALGRRSLLSVRRTRRRN